LHFVICGLLKSFSLYLKLYATYESVESINSAVGELSSTNRTIEHIKPIVKQHEQVREQTRSKKFIKCKKKT